MEKTLLDENEDVIASFGLLDLEDNNNRFYIHLISYYLHLSNKFSLQVWLVFVKVV
jgi:hypothetical protein